MANKGKSSMARRGFATSSTITNRLMQPYIPSPLAQSWETYPMPSSYKTNHKRTFDVVPNTFDPGLGVIEAVKQLQTFPGLPIVKTPLSESEIEARRRAYGAYYSKWKTLIHGSSTGDQKINLRFEDVPWPTFFPVKSNLDFANYFGMDTSIPYSQARIKKIVHDPSLSEHTKSVLFDFFLNGGPESEGIRSDIERDGLFRSIDEFHRSVWHPNTIGRYLLERIDEEHFHDVHRAYTRIHLFLYSGSSGLFTGI